MGVLTPPMTPPQTSPKLSSSECTPAEVEVEDNYVTRTLKNQPMLPPLDRHNWYKEMVWLNVGIIFVTPVVGLVGAYYTELRWETALFSIFYYFLTGMGEYALACGFIPSPHLPSRYHRGVPSVVGPPLL